MREIIQKQIYLQAEGDAYCALEQRLPTQGRPGNRILKPAPMGTKGRVYEEPEERCVPEAICKRQPAGGYGDARYNGFTSYPGAVNTNNNNNTASIQKQKSEDSKTLIPNVTISSATAEDNLPRLVYNLGRELTIYSAFDVKKPTSPQSVKYKTYREPNLPSCHAVSKNGTLAVGFALGQIQILPDLALLQRDIKINDQRMIEMSRVIDVAFLNDGSKFLSVHESGALFCYDLNANGVDNVGRMGDPLRDRSAGDVEALVESKSSGVDNGRLKFGRVEEFSTATVTCLTCHNVRSRTALLNKHLPQYKLFFASHQGAREYINALSVCPTRDLTALACKSGSVKIAQLKNFSVQSDTRLSPSPSTTSSTVKIPHEFYSYFGEFKCVQISNCGRFVAAGGEDNRVTIYVIALSCVLFRLGGGPRAWISSVTFDPHTSCLEHCDKFFAYYKSRLHERPSSADDSFKIRRKRTISSNYSENYALGMSWAAGRDGSPERANVGSSFSIRILAGSEDGRLSIWDIDQADFSRSVTLLTEKMRQLALERQKMEASEERLADESFTSLKSQTSIPSSSKYAEECDDIGSQNDSPASTNESSLPISESVVDHEQSDFREVYDLLQTNGRCAPKKSSLMSKIAGIGKEVYSTMKKGSTLSAISGLTQSKYSNGTRHSNLDQDGVTYFTDDYLGTLACPGFEDISLITSISSTRVHAGPVQSICVTKEHILLGTCNRGLQIWKKSDGDPIQ